jgi:4-carboxymuconolactone decarboxylase
MPPRIAPLDPPYEPQTEKYLRSAMGEATEVEPLRLFRTLAVHEELASRMRPLGAGILGHGLVAPRERELLILRTCARAGAEYEWGVHAAFFAAGVGLGDDQVEASWSGGPADFAGADELMIRLADELHDTATVSGELWHELAASHDDAQLIELVTICGWYRTIAGLINAVGVEPESWARRAARAARA